MARYIDEELLIEKMSRLRGCSCSYSDGIIDEVEDIMSDLPTADVIPLDRIKEARAEIENKIHKDPYLNFSNRNRERNDAFIEVLEILDNLIKSEE